jgi:hypothetical protein
LFSETNGSCINNAESFGLGKENVRGGDVLSSIRSSEKNEEERISSSRKTDPSMKNNESKKPTTPVLPITNEERIPFTVERMASDEGRGRMECGMENRSPLPQGYYSTNVLY